MSLLLAGGALWLFLTAIPALADGGPHLTSVNSGTSTLTADSCAGCHRAHTAQSQYLLKQASEELLCLSCHGNGGTLATVNVENGVQYVPAGNGTRTGTVLGALRDGGFLTARIAASDPSRLSYIRGYDDSPFNTVYAISTRPKVGVGASEAVNSAHIDLANQPGNGIADTHTLWGKGDTGLGTPSVSLTCVECHNPHGNGQYRILRPVPGVEADPLGEATPVAIQAAYTNADTIVTDGQHGLVVGDRIVVNGLADIARTITDVDASGVFTATGHGFVVGQTVIISSPLPAASDDIIGYPDGAYVIATVPSANTFTLTTGTPGTAQPGLSGYAATASFTNATYYVGGVTNGFTIKLAPSLAFIGNTINLPNFSGAGATLTRPEVAVADVNPDPDNDQSYPTKNYTVIQTKGSQGVDSTYLLYARDVLAARAGNGVAQDQPSVAITGVVASGSSFMLSTGGNAHGLAVGDLIDLTGGPWTSTTPAVSFTPGAGPYTVASVGASAGSSFYNLFTVVGVTLSAADADTGTVVRKAIDGDYTATGGDYFRRTIPWDPSINNPNCKNDVYSSTNSAYCGTANDAPNGRPSTITSGPTALIGQQAFLDQISTWCSECHTRYYSNSNENIADAEPITALSEIPVASSSGANITVVTYAPTNTRYATPSYGDKVTFANIPGGNTLSNGVEYYVVATGTGTFQVATTMGGSSITASPAITSGMGVTYTRTYQSSNSGWGYPRVDDTYKYQHSTASNRACVVCHVAHGSNAEMTGPDSLAVTYPDGTTTSTSSRLLKVDNRGTCQMCHDPTGTVQPGTYLGAAATVP